MKCLNVRDLWLGKKGLCHVTAAEMEGPNSAGLFLKYDDVHYVSF